MRASCPGSVGSDHWGRDHPWGSSGGMGREPAFFPMGLELGCQQILNPHLCLPECASTHQSSDLQFPWGQMAEGAHSDTPAPVWFSSDNRDEPGCLETFTWVGLPHVPRTSPGQGTGSLCSPHPIGRSQNKLVTSLLLHWLKSLDVIHSPLQGSSQG